MSHFLRSLLSVKLLAVELPSPNNLIFVSFVVWISDGIEERFAV